MKKCILEVNHNPFKDLSELSPHEILIGYRDVVMTGKFHRTEIDEIIKLISSFSYGDIQKSDKSKKANDKKYGVWKKERKGKNKKVVVKKLDYVGGAGGGGGNFNTAGTINTK